jgi:hypothetical protein
MEDDRIKRVICKRQRSPIRFLKRKIRQPLCQFPRLGHKDRRRVDPDGPAHPWPSRQHTGHRARAATYLQHPCPLREGRIGQICMQHRPLLRVGGAEFQGGHQAFKDFRGGLRDLGIDVGHSN